MNKTKIILPVAALMMMPLFTSCNKGALAEVLLNHDDCIVYRYGPSTCHVKIDSDSEVTKDFTFNENIKKEDFAEPTGASKLAGKEIKDIKRSDDGKSIDITYDGTLAIDDIPFGTFAAIRIKKDGFEQDSRGGRIRLALRENHYLVQHKDTEKGCEFNLLSIGGDFASTLLAEKNGKLVLDETGSFLKGDVETGISIAEYSGDVKTEYPVGSTLEISELKETLLGKVYKLILEAKDKPGGVVHPVVRIDGFATQIGALDGAKPVAATLNHTELLAKFAEAAK